jgi:CPA2 family monovalent cation:H+ antiporter-2
VTLGAFLSGQSIRTSVQAGMSLAQIGEFSFIIVGLGLAMGKAGDQLYVIAVAVSAITTLLTPWLIRSAEPTAAFVDRKLPRALQTFVALYGSWIEQLRSGSQQDGSAGHIRRLIRWLLVDAAVVAAIVIGASIEMPTLSGFVRKYIDVSERAAELVVILAAVLVSAPFWIGMIRVTRFLGLELATRALPAAQGKADTADAPRRLLVVTLQLAIVILVGAPLVAVTQPFVPPLQGAIVLVLLLALLAIVFWRRATSLQGHTRAAAQIIAEALAQHTREARATTDDRAEQAEYLLSGLGSPTPVHLDARSPVLGRTLSEINLRGRTGATILAIGRGETRVLVPAGRDRLQEGDVLALAGSKEAIEDAKEVLLGASGPATADATYVSTQA